MCQNILYIDTYIHIYIYTNIYYIYIDTCICMCICIKTSSPCLPIPGILQSPRPLALRCGPRPAGRVVVAAGFAALGRRAAGLGPGAAGVVAVAAGRGTSGAADADGWDEVGHLGLQKNMGKMVVLEGYGGIYDGFIMIYRCRINEMIFGLMPKWWMCPYFDGY